MRTTNFLEYLHRNESTRVLAEQLAGVLVLRREDALVPAGVLSDASSRIAS